MVNKQLTIKQEMFCNAYVNHLGNGTMAYEECYETKNMKPASIYGCVTRLLNTVLVWQRIQELKDVIWDKYTFDREFIANNLLVVLQKAHHLKKYDLMRKTAMDIGRLHGLIIEKQDINTNHQFNTMKEVTLDGDKLIFNVGSASLKSDEPLVISHEPFDVDVTDLL